jgi:hypothetical protein
MARNLGREYASMTEEERREFELKRARGEDGGSEEELELEDPRRYPPPKGPSDAREGQGK